MNNYSLRCSKNSFVLGLFSYKPWPPFLPLHARIHLYEFIKKAETSNVVSAFFYFQSLSNQKKYLEEICNV